VTFFQGRPAVKNDGLTFNAILALVIVPIR
jgi:hypothetical protein